MGKPQISAIDRINRVQLVCSLNDWLHSFYERSLYGRQHDEHIEHAGELNSQAYNDAIVEFKAAIDTDDLKEARMNLSMVTTSLENVDAAKLHPRQSVYRSAFPQYGVKQ